jgi:hypothetical protein
MLCSGQPSSVTDVLTSAVAADAAPAGAHARVGDAFGRHAHLDRLVPHADAMREHDGVGVGVEVDEGAQDFVGDVDAGQVVAQLVAVLVLELVADRWGCSWGWGCCHERIMSR